MPRAGLEPARRYSQPRILSPVRLPLSPPGHLMKEGTLIDKRHMRELLDTKYKSGVLTCERTDKLTYIVRIV